MTYEECRAAAQRAHEYTDLEMAEAEAWYDAHPDAPNCYRGLCQDEIEARLGWWQPGVCEYWNPGDSRVGY